MTRFDAIRLRQLVERHLAFTGSAVATRLLADWAGSLAKFKKVMPVDYRRALQEMQTAVEKAKTAA
jgi:glutamate synthase (NADPH/NADH) large chain